VRSQDFYHFAGAELRPDATARVTHAVRADQKFAPCNSMLNADNRFSGFAMRIKEDQCSYTNHQNNVTYYNMVNQLKIQNCQLYNKIPLPLSFTTVGLKAQWLMAMSK
jgi:glucokinase